LGAAGGIEFKCSTECEWFGKCISIGWMDGWIVTKPSPSTFKTAVKMEVKAFKSMIENYIFLSNAGL